MLINRQTDTQILGYILYLYNGIPISNKEEQILCQGKEAKTKQDVLYDSIFMKSKNSQN